LLLSHLKERCDTQGKRTNEIKRKIFWWWRTQSQSNRSHRSNSLLTGKITGNFDNLGPVGEISGKICEADRGVANKFPNQRNREFYPITGKAFAGYRELGCRFVN